MIVFIDIRNLYLTCLLGQESGSNGPQVVVRNGVVIDLNEGAGQFDIEVGMTRRQAAQLCSGLQVTDFEAGACQELYDRLWRRLSCETPLVQPMDYHQGYLDLTGCASGCRDMDRIMEGLQSEFLFSNGLKLNWGGGQDKWMARVACGGDRSISPDKEPQYLARLPLNRLGLGSDVCRRLHRYGIHSIGDLMRVPMTFFATHLQLADGDIASLLQRGDRTVLPAYPPPEIAHEVEFEWGNQTEKGDKVQQLSNDSAASLAHSNYRAHELLIELCLRDTIQSVRVHFDKPVREPERIQKHLTQACSTVSAMELRSIRAVFRGLVPDPTVQQDLWDARTARQEEALDALRERLRNRYGTKALLSGREYDRMYPRRFAQLICEARGWNCP